MKLMFQTLKKHNLRYKGFLTFYLITAFIISVASVFMTRLVGDMGQAAVETEMNVLLRFFGFVTILMAIQAIASAASALILGRFAGKAGYRFRDNFVRFFLRKPFAIYEGTKSGEALSVYQNDLPSAVRLISDGGIRMLADIIVLLVTFTYMMYLNWWLTLIFFASFPVLIIVQVLIATPIQKKQQTILKRTADMNAIANDSFQNTSTIIAYSLEKTMLNRLRNSYEDLIDAHKNAARSFLFLILAGILASLSPMLIIIAVAAAQVIAGNMSIAEWIAFTALAGEAGSWLSMLSQRQNQVQTGSAGANRLNEHMEGEPEDIDAGITLDLSNDGNIITAENVKFTYAKGVSIDVNPPTDDMTSSESETKLPEPTLALDGVSFEIKKGSRVAFVGGSGSGKSTVLKLLLGLYPPTEGELMVGGKDIKDISLNSLRAAYAYVPQDSYLFPESILGNITGESEITDLPRLEKACQDAGILSFIESLPDGFDTILNEAAENVSGGQKQRIALARAFYRDAPVILFDEATSALDPKTEAAVLDSFSSLSRDKTVIMVAHRPKAIDFCDQIFVMDNGKIVERIGE